MSLRKGSTVFGRVQIAYMHKYKRANPSKRATSKQNGKTTNNKKKKHFNEIAGYFGFSGRQISNKK